LGQNAATRSVNAATQTIIVATTNGTAAKYRVPIIRKSTKGNVATVMAETRVTINAQRSPATAEGAA
jgi:hypothetical protein